jgi:hypothetical protein
MFFFFILVIDIGIENLCKIIHFKLKLWKKNI